MDTSRTAARTDRPDNVGVVGAAVFRERAPASAQRPFEAPPVASNRLDNGDREEPQRRAQAAGSADAAAAADSRAANAAPPAPTSASPPSLRERDSLAKSEKLGTGHGEREYSPTTQTSFERASAQPAEVVQVRYDSYANLVASGIIGRPRLPTTPDPFPAFVPDPR